MRKTLLPAALILATLLACGKNQRWVGIDGRTTGATQQAGDAEAPTPSAASVAPPAVAPVLCTTDNQRGEQTLGLPSAEAWNDLIADAGEPDVIDSGAMRELGGVWIPDGSRCELIAQERGLTRIRVSDGAASGFEGWVYATTVNTAH